MIAPAKARETGRQYAILYCRFSPRSRSAECLSCDKQLADLRRHCEQRGYVIRGEFRDDAMSGKKIEGREGLAAALNAMRRGDIFLCRDTSRLSRRMLDALTLVADMSRKGVILETLQDGLFDPKDPNKFIVFGIKAVMNEFQRVQSSIDTSKATRRYQREGRLMSKVPMYGKMIDPENPKRTVDNEAELSVIAQIVELRSRGESAQGIADTLHGLGITFRGKAWDRGTLRKILLREGART